MAITGSGTGTVNGNGGSRDDLTGLASGVSNMTDSGTNDTFEVTNTGDIISGDSTGLVKSTVNWNLGSTHSTGVDDLTLTGTANLTGTGNTGTDTLTSNTGTDKLLGNATLGNDTFYVNHAGDTVTETTATGNAAIDRAVVYSNTSFTLGTNIEDLYLTGSANLSGTGNNLANTIVGNTGTDVLSDGGVNVSGGDTMTGNSTAGTDTFIVNNAGDHVSEAGGAATTALIKSATTFSLAGTGVNDLTLTGAGHGLTATGNAHVDILNDSTTGSGTNVLIGDGGADTFFLTHAGDTATESNVAGGALVNSTINYTLTANMSGLTLSGSGALTGTGNNTADVLTSGTGVDSLVGHSATGSDTFVVNNAGDKVTEAGTHTGDYVISDVSFDLATDGATASTTTNINNLTLTGASAITGTGNTTAGILTSSMTGTDKLIGGGGADTFNLNHAGDTASETNGVGGAIVNADISFTLGTNMGTLHLTGAGLTGTALTGAAAETITTTGGVDTIVGNTGADTLSGNGGADVFKINGAGTTAAETNVAGHASVTSDVSFALSANMSSLTLTGTSNITGTGNNTVNVLTTAAGTTAGTDALIGDGGADTFILNHTGDTATENNGAGGALVESVGTVTLGANISELILTGTLAASGIGNATGDLLISNTGADTLAGNATSGVDSFIVNNAADVITANVATAATDVVVSDATFSLMQNATTKLMHTLTLTGAAAATATGNNLADVLTSSTTGTDKLIGNATALNDTFNVKHAGDTVTELGTGTANLVNSTISFSLGANLQKLVLEGSTNLTGVGNAVADSITGNTGTDLLSDGGSHTAAGTGDTLIGHSAGGTDSFIVSNTADVISEANPGTTSLVSTSVSWNLAGANSTGVNNATLTGAGHGLSLTGNLNADILIDATTSTTGGNTLIGDSSSGHDTFILSHTGDVAQENGSTVGEVIISTTSQILTGASAGAITLSGTAALTATGNTGADTLTASATGADKLIGDATNGGDTFYVNNVADTVTENGTTSNNGNLVVSTVSFNLGTQIGGTGHGVNDLTFTGAAAVLGTGNTNADILISNTGADTLIGKAASGHDTFVVNNAGDHVSETGLALGDVVDSTVSWTLGTAGSAGVTGGFSSLTLQGAGHGLKAVGNTGTDTITDATTGTGSDTLIGNSTGGSDTFIVDHANDSITEANAGTVATVISSANFTLGAHLENLTLTGASALTGVGNTGANVITGNTGNDVLNDGTDTVGGASGDTLVGNSSAGNDIFIVSNTNDHVSEAGENTLSVIDSSVSLNLATNITNVNILTLTAANISATGNAGENDTLSDGGANDTLTGNSTAGADTFYVTHTGDAVSETTTATTALIESSVSFNLATGAHGGTTGVSELSLFNGATLQTATGNALNDLITDNDTVVGGGKNILTDGNNGGHDTFIDNAGNDTFTVNSLLDSVSEMNAGSTSAAVNSSVNFTLGSNINSLTLSGAATSGAGNGSGGDTITGNTNADVLSDNGATTADRLTGHSSTGDTFLVSNIGDTVSEAGSGTGSIINIDKTGTGGMAFSLVGTGATELEFTVGTGNDTLTAAATGNDTLIGSAGNGGGGNVFHDGGTGGGNDKLVGNSSAGTDTFYVNNTGDLVTETGTATSALINSTVGYNLDTGADGVHTTNASALTLVAGSTVTGISLTGNANSDTITDNGTNGLNVLADGTTGVAAASFGGHDTMIDSSTYGGDTFVVNSVLDSVTESSVVHQGTVISSVNFTLGTNFNVLTLDGGTANAATGNATGGDTITGNSSAASIISDNHGAAIDSLVGHHSGDTFVLYNALDNVTETGSGLVQLQSGSSNDSFSLTGTGVHQLTMFGTGNDAGTGTTGNDTIIGNSGNDTLSDGGAGAGGDSLQGHSSTGGDVFVVNNANDTINEAANVGGSYDGIVTSLTTHGVVTSAFDSLTGAYAGFYNLTVTGSTGSSLTGNNLANVITGNTGDDTIVSGTGADTLVGNSAGGNDTFVVNNANDSVTEHTTAAAALVESSVNFSLVGTGVNELTLTAGNLTATGNTGADTITGNSTGDVLLSGSGVDSLVAGTGNETFIINNAGDTIGESHGGTTSIVEAYANFTLSTNLTSLTLETGATTGAGNGAGGDTITGNTSNDLLSDGGNALAGDSLVGNSTVGGSGNDTFLISNAADSITETAGVGAGAAIWSTLSYTLGGGFTNLQLVDGATGKTATGDTVNDTIKDNDTAGGHNILTDGNAGGLDTMIDYAGNDTFVVSYAGDSVTENHVSTSSLVESSVTFTLGTNMNNLLLEGASNINGTGTTAGGNSLTGNTGNDVLSDNQSALVTAADTLIGHSLAGHDTFIVYNTADLVSEAGTANGNEIITWGTYSVASTAGIEKLELTGTGNGLVNTITGNGENDTLIDTTGTGGNILTAGSGQDSFVDSNVSSTGDTFYADNVADQFSEAHGAGTVIWSSGLDVTYTLGTNITHVTLAGSGNDSITANNAAVSGDVITAGSGAGTDIISDGLAGGIGNDTFNAGAGTTDTFIVNNTGDVINGNNSGAAGDVIDYYVTGGSQQLGANINNLVIESNGSGGNDNDTITANAGNDLITANTHSNTFNDGGTHNGTGLVTSAGGADTFSGGGGFDVFNINNSNDVIIEANPGQYLINSYASFTLGTNLGNLTLLGEQSLTGTATTVGGAVIVGNYGSDILSDGGDATVGVGDILIGNDTSGSPGDTFIVSNTADTVSENGSYASTVEASVNFTLGLGTTHLLLTGGGNLHGTANTTNNNQVLVGNTGNDVLSDGGNDTGTGDNLVVAPAHFSTMIGHSGNTGDTFMVYDASDSITELGGATGSVIDAYVNYTLVSNVNVLNIDGNQTHITGTGNSGTDTINDNGTSTVGGNVLVSGSGVDSLIDSSTTGSDTFVINNTADTVAETNGSGVVESYVSFSIAADANIHTLTLEGAGNATAAGHAAGGDTITANTGTDILSDNGASGLDHFVGGTGHDTFIVSLATDVINTAAGGTYTIETALNGAGYDTLTSAYTGLILTAGHQTGEAYTSGHDSIVGQGGSDIITDSTNTAAGDSDSLSGTGGSDTFNVNNVADVVTETGASATINSTVNFTMSANMTVLNLTAGGISGTGNSGADAISNTSGSADTLVGGTGADTLTGDGGADVFYVNSTATATHVTESDVAGGAIVNSDVNFTLGAHMSKLIFSGDINLTGTGNGGADTIIGNQGDDLLVDGGGAATMTGNSIDGGDTFTVSNASDVIAETNAGTSALVNVNFSGGTVTLGTHIENATIGAGYGTDTILGSGTANLTMTDNGNGGDVLNAGGSGADTLTDASTAGGDTFDVNNALDIVSETNGTTGVVNYSVGAGSHSFSLSAQITTIDAHGSTGNDTFTGYHAGGDTITGSTTAGGDVISDASGTAGDSLIGHGALDTFVVTNASDTIDELGAAGVIKATNVDWTLASNTTNITTLDISTTGAAHTATGITTAAVTLDDLTGGNILTVGTGSTHADTLIGGADTMNLSTGSGHDTVEFSAAAGYNGVATINNFNVVNDTLNIDNIITNSTNAATSYHLVADASNAANTDVLVDYNIGNVSYGYIEVAEIIGHTVAALSGIAVS